MSFDFAHQAVKASLDMDSVSSGVQGSKCLFVAYHPPGASRPASINNRRLMCGLRDIGWHLGLLSTMDRPDRMDLPDGIEYMLIKKPGRLSRPGQTFTKSASDSGNSFVRFAAAASHKLPLPLRAWWLAWAGQAAQWAKRFSPNIILSRSNPPESHMMAAILARMLRIPWVAYFGDYWADNHFSTKTGILYQFEKTMERKVMSGASAIVSISEPMASHLGRVHNKPASVVTNCFPLETNETPVPLEGEWIDLKIPLRILFTGRVYPDLRMPDMLMDAIAELRQRGDVVDGEVLVEFYCPNHDFLEKWLANTYPDLSAMYKVFPPVSLNESLRLQKEADILYASIWFGPGHEGVTSSKFFEYLAARRKVWVSLAGPGALTKICRRTDAAADLYNVDDCKLHLMQALEMARDGKSYLYPQDRWQKVLEYSCAGQSRKLSMILTEYI